MVDQYSAEITWETLRYLATWRRNKRGFKVELWLYFGHALMPRGMQFNQDKPDAEYAKRVDRMFGTTQWRELWHARHDGFLTGEQFRAELVNLMRWRLEKDLGYTTTIPLEFTNTMGHPIYTVIFATSNATGDKIMGSVFAKHGVALEKMRAAKRVERIMEKDSEDSLFGAPRRWLSWSPRRQHVSRWRPPSSLSGTRPPNPLQTKASRPIAVRRVHVRGFLASGLPIA